MKIKSIPGILDRNRVIFLSIIFDHKKQSASVTLPAGRENRLRAERALNSELADSCDFKLVLRDK